eukprot:TRINITY_DN14845_c0_g1_i1.p1 TRINITY_DN14845_c0_g1~~TRINITY_DN14845_c0_g1_i1.p1  ORF type:complete len:280 (+),score=66.63 TRINITY_DN14845_c0_g1_i1:138-977(+)
MNIVSGNIEEKLLNGPSVMDNDNDDIRHSEIALYSDDEEEEDDDKSEGGFDEGGGGGPPPMQQQGPPPSRRGGRTQNTGPKGVIHDYNQAKARMVENRAKENARVWKMIEDQSVVFRDGDGTNADEEEEEDSDDDFMAEYRKKRMAELQEMASMPRYGVLQSLSRQTFVDAVENEPPNIIVVVHMYDVTNESCALLNKHLEQMSPSFPHLKLCRMLSEHASQKFDPVAHPALLVYRGGDMVQCHLRLTDQLGYRFSKEDVESFFRKEGLIRETSTYKPQ